jgi:hypothetical protein
VNTVNLPQRPLPGYDYTPRSLFNNTVANAQASADQRFNMKPLDRAGFSRGAAQQQYAGISGSKALADGIADAYTQEATDAGTRAMSGLTGEQEREQYAQALGALQQQNAYATALAGIQRAGALRGLMG